MNSQYLNIIEPEIKLFKFEIIIYNFHYKKILTLFIELNQRPYIKLIWGFKKFININPGILGNKVIKNKIKGVEVKMHHNSIQVEMDPKEVPNK